MNVAAVPEANPLNLPAVNVSVEASYDIAESTDTPTPDAVEEIFENNGYKVPVFVETISIFAAVVAFPDTNNAVEL